MCADAVDAVCVIFTACDCSDIIPRQIFNSATDSFDQEGVVSQVLSGPHAYGSSVAWCMEMQETKKTK